MARAKTPWRQQKVKPNPDINRHLGNAIKRVKANPSKLPHTEHGNLSYHPHLDEKAHKGVAAKTPHGKGGMKPKGMVGPGMHKGRAPKPNRPRHLKRVV